MQKPPFANTFSRRDISFIMTLRKLLFHGKLIGFAFFRQVPPGDDAGKLV